LKPDIAAETLRAFSLTHNYNRWVMDLLTPYVGKRILEIGCGVGNLTLHLQRLGELSCIDVSRLYLDHMRIDYPGVAFYHYDVADPNVRSLANQHFDTLACVNVLEHVKDDRTALRNMFEILGPGGRLLVFVPAIARLHNRLDQDLGHFRRYDKRQLQELIAGAGFQIDRLMYSNLIGTFGWFLNGTVQRKRQLSVWQTMLFDNFVPLVEKLERHMKLPFGMSLFAVATKS